MILWLPVILQTPDVRFFIAQKSLRKITWSYWEKTFFLICLKNSCCLMGGRVFSSSEGTVRKECGVSQCCYCFNGFRKWRYSVLLISQQTPGAGRAVWDWLYWGMLVLLWLHHRSEWRSGQSTRYFRKLMNEKHTCSQISFCVCVCVSAITQVHTPCTLFDFSFLSVYGTWVFNFQKFPLCKIKQGW